MINTIKGWVKRLSTPRKEKTYIPDQDNYGEYEWRYISSFNISTINNIILELDITSSYDDTSNDTSILLRYAPLVGLRILTYKFPNRTCIFLSGSCINYTSLLSLQDTELSIDTNRIVRSLITLLQKIDIMYYYIQNLFPDMVNDIDPDYLPYITRNKTITANDPISIQDIPTDNIYPEVLKTDYMNKFIYITKIIIYNEKELLPYYISDIVNILNFSEYAENYMINGMKDSLYSNFNISGFKNIFDINLKVTNDGESMYNDIDEPIE